MCLFLPTHASSCVCLRGPFLVCVSASASVSTSLCACVRPYRQRGADACTRAPARACLSVCACLRLCVLSLCVRACVWLWPSACRCLFLFLCACAPQCVHAAGCSRATVLSASKPLWSWWQGHSGRYKQAKGLPAQGPQLRPRAQASHGPGYTGPQRWLKASHACAAARVRSVYLDAPGLACCICVRAVFCLCL